MIETPVGADQAQLDQEDALTRGLLTVAYSDPEAKPRATSSAVSRFGTRHSRFWFKLETLSEETERRKAQFKPKELEHIDAEVTSRLKTFKKEMPVSLRGKIEEVREFFLTQISPLVIASSGGTIQAKDVAERMFKTEVDSAIFGRFDNMVNRAATIKVALFVLAYFDLPDEFLSSLLPSQQHNPDSDMQKLQAMVKQLVDTQTNQGQQLKKVVTHVTARRPRPQGG
jgi:hypothetical protein